MRIMLYLSGFVGEQVKSLIALKQTIEDTEDLGLDKLFDVPTSQNAKDGCLYWLIPVNVRHLSCSPAEVDVKGSNHNTYGTIFK